MAVQLCVELLQLQCVELNVMQVKYNKLLFAGCAAIVSVPVLLLLVKNRIYPFVWVACFFYAAFLLIHYYCKIEIKQEGFVVKRILREKIYLFEDIDTIIISKDSFFLNKSILIQIRTKDNQRQKIHLSVPSTQINEFYSTMSGRTKCFLNTN